MINLLIREEEESRVNNSWKQIISEMIHKKKENNTYREFKKINKDARQTPKAEEVKRVELVNLTSLP